MSTLRKSLDGCERRRLWLMRHSEVSYVNADGTPVADGRVVELTERGVEMARQTARMLAEVPFDRAICSGLKRTVQTASIILNGRAQPRLEIHPALEEMRGIRGIAASEGQDPPRVRPEQLAYTFWDAGDPEGRFMGGELYAEAAQRSQQTIGKLLTEPGWQSMLAVCHGGINRLLLCWAIGAPLSCMAPFEQDSCCINVVDFDIDSRGKLRRAVLRAVNLSARDSVKASRDLITMEEVAVQIGSQRALSGDNEPD